MRPPILLFVLVACGGEAKSGGGALPLTFETTWDTSHGAEMIEVKIHTEPDASVSATIDYGQPTVAKADAKGDATLRVTVNPVGPAEIQLDIKGYEKPGKRTHHPFAKTVKLARAPSLSIDPDGRGWCRVKQCQAVITDEGKVEMTNLEGVASVTIAGAAATVTAGKASHQLDIEPLATKVPIADIFKSRDSRGSDGPTKIDVEIAWTDGTKAKGALPFPWRAFREAVVALLTKPGPSTLQDKGTGRGLLTLPSTLSPDVTRLGDIGFVAAYTDALRTQECGTYKSDKGEVATLERTIRDAKVTVYERATGKVLGEKTFPPPASRCPKVSANGTMPEAVYERGGADRAWIASLVK